MKLLRVYLPHGKPKIGGSSREIFRRLCRVENHEQRKALLQTKNLPGKFPPRGGNHRHRHRHRAGLHWDHHHHHLHHQDHHHHHHPHLAVTSWVGSCVVHRGNSL